LLIFEVISRPPLPLAITGPISKTQENGAKGAYFLAKSAPLWGIIASQNQALGNSSRTTRNGRPIDVAEDDRVGVFQRPNDLHEGGVT
jgi:hypothetical protein